MGQQAKLAGAGEGDPDILPDHPARRVGVTVLGQTQHPCVPKGKASLDPRRRRAVTPKAQHRGDVGGQGLGETKGDFGQGLGPSR